MAFDFVLFTYKIYKSSDKNKINERKMLEYLSHLGGFVYAYCTDFIINLANLTGTSYYEINALLFCIMWPALTVVLLIVFLFQKYRFRKILLRQILKTK